MKNSFLSRDQRVSILIWISLAVFYLTYKEIAAFYYPTSTIIIQYDSLVSEIIDTAQFQNNTNFQKEQIGSSAMPYKMNPITCEKICSLSRLVMNYETDIVQTYINQWLERTLDDSAIKRIIIPDCFMLVEHILTEMNNCLQTLYINREQIDKNVEEHMPKILSEQIILCGVKLGYDRQDIHERLRVVFLHKKNFSEDEIIQKILDTYEISMDPNKYVGRCEHQVKAFYKGH